ncbi:rhomboid family intramembrane serine protease [Paenibacillus tarimensis]|uniref:rhomboid family intramembrane serine protease n=1 Tax=Paenibacillus tarimensis TaxID=416012 RepID=UPI001F4807F0|nr:rhomboid family intramembrane serine protease [Paenibacillus tarimensis]MCF2943229.1 rhomboid family intramembrane serine protease [Paenibacillus tarimensis]
MIFLRYESFRGYLRAYPVTSALLGINILLFMYNWIAAGEPLLNRFAFFQHELLDPYGLTEPWRYLTSIFLHAGWEHLLFNCFSILVFAPPLERLLGRYRYLFFYLLAGIFGNVFSAFINTLGTYGVHYSVGASGAIYGIFGAYLYLAVFRKHALDEGSRKTIYTILVFGLIYSLLSTRIDIWAHMGGGLAGFIMMSLFVRKR